MAPGGRGSLRPYQPSRFQPFLIVCLLVTVVVVGYNFWNLMKKNSVLLVEIGKLQGTLRRLESERKDCKVQLASVEAERRHHEASDKEKENTLEDTRRLVEDLNAETKILKLNVSSLLTHLESSALKENALKSECNQTVEATRTEMRDSCIGEKEKIEEEMNNQLAAMKKQLKIQYQETEHLDQMLQQQQQKQGLGDGKGGDKSQVGNIPEQQSQVPQREIQASQPDEKSQPANRFIPGRFSNNRENPGDRRNSTYHSKGSRSRNSQRWRGSMHRGQPEPVGNYGELRATQTALDHIPDERSSSISDPVSVNSYQQKLTKESENEGIRLNEPRGEAVEEQPKLIPEAVPDAGNSHSDQTAVVADENSLKFQRHAQESIKSDSLNQRSGDQEQYLSRDDGNTDDREVVHDGRDQAANEKPSLVDPTKLKRNYQNDQGSLQIVEIPKRNLVAGNLPDDTQNRQLDHQDNNNNNNRVPSQN